MFSSGTLGVAVFVFVFVFVIVVASMEETPWSHPDLTVPHLLSLLRAFMDMLSLASGFQSSGSPALWRPHDITRALGWATLIEQIMKKIPASEGGVAFTKSVDVAIEEMMHEYPMQEGSMKLTSAILTDARKLFLRIATDALGCHDGHMESIIMASSNDEKDRPFVLQLMQERHQTIKNVKTLVNAVQSAVPTLDRIITNYGMSCCKQWRKNALEYFLDEKTLFKLAGASVIFKADERKWGACFEKILFNKDATKVVEIAELCCLQLSCHKRDEIIKKLMEPCRFVSCSRESIIAWRSHSIAQVIESEEEDSIAAYLIKMLKQNEITWWSVPPILAAAASVKGTPLFDSYVAEINQHARTGSHVDRSYDQGTDAGTDDISERIWALQFLDDTFSEKYKVSI